MSLYRRFCNSASIFNTRLSPATGSAFCIVRFTLPSESTSTSVISYLRSQIKNRAKAMKVLKTRILDNILQEQNAKMAADRKQQVGSGDRSERIRTYNFPQGRMTDHRIGLTLYRLDSIMAGDIEEITDALRTHYQMEALKAQSEGA